MVFESALSTWCSVVVTTCHCSHEDQIMISSTGQEDYWDIAGGGAVRYFDANSSASLEWIETAARQRRSVVTHVLVLWCVRTSQAKPLLNFSPKPRAITYEACCFGLIRLEVIWSGNA